MRDPLRRALFASSGKTKRCKNQKAKGKRLAEDERNNQARRAMIAEIRRQLAASAPFDAAQSERRAAREIITQTRQPSVDFEKPTGSLSERFLKSLEAVSGHCEIARDENEAAEFARRIIESRQARSIAISDSPLVQRVMARVKTDATTLRNPSKRDLFDCDIGITGAEWGVAETGTLTLGSDRENNRLASLVPPAHIAIIEARCIRQTLAEALEEINKEGRDGLSRVVTFITGPSRTSDIELTLAIGVHGPAEVYVIIIEGENHAG
jgi:L-lactate dehydrogenase complex protein LldG